MLWPKKADRAGLHARRPAWALGLVRGRGRAVSSRAASRPILAAARRTGHPAAEYIRGGTTKILTLFHPASGQVRLQPAACCTNAVLHPWLRERLSAILAELPGPTASQDAAATQAAWAVWQAGLMVPFTLPDNLPPLRLFLVWDNLAGHKTPDLVLWLCAHGVMPLYTPVGGSWLNMAESIERVLKRRALDGQHPHSPEAIGSWFEQTA